LPRALLHDLYYDTEYYDIEYYDIA